MRTICTLLLAGLATLQVFAADLPAYALYTKTGKPAKFEQMCKVLAQHQVILFGEFHDDAIAHWLQLRTTEALFTLKGGKLVLGAEMFEADMQEPLSAYIQGKTEEEAFKKALTSLWANYKTDYRPLVELAKARSLHFVASNVPRYIARAVYKGGFAALDTLPAEVKSLLPALPIPYDATLPGYKAMLEMGGGHGGENLPRAQAIKDATMAHHISRNLKEGYSLIHYNGAYHSNNYEGIVWYLKQYAPQLSVATITTVRQKDVRKLEKEYIGMADFIICVDESMTRTH
ncbi:MAG: ChaN family lipoprotein [Flavobacteriales bacterium]